MHAGTAFFGPNPCNCIAPEADCGAERKLAPKQPASPEKGPGDSQASRPRSPAFTLLQAGGDQVEMPHERAILSHK
jgi:hypothetical protein